MVQDDVTRTAQRYGRHRRQVQALLDRVEIASSWMAASPPASCPAQSRPDTGPLRCGVSSAIMHRCDRTPSEILIPAPTLGLLRGRGMLTGPTTQRDWESIRCEVEGPFLPGRKVTLRRPAVNSPHPLLRLWPRPLLRPDLFGSRDAELDALIGELQRNGNLDGFTPSRQVVLAASEHLHPNE